MIRSEFWPVPSAHEEYWQQHNFHYAGDYDPADDGPEVDIIARLHKASPLTDPDSVASHVVRLWVDDAAETVFLKLLLIEECRAAIKS